MHRRILITMGDPSGIGPEVVIKSLASRKIGALADFFVIGDRLVLEKTAKRLKRRPPANIVDLKNVSSKKFRFGKPDINSGRAGMEYLGAALSFIKNDNTLALVTAPISKEAINKAGFHYGGHTEFLAKMTGTSKFAMMLSGGPLRVVLLTRHIPIKKVPARLNKKMILDAICLSSRADG